MVNPDGDPCYVFFRGRKSGVGKGQHWYGIPMGYLDRADYIAFWACDAEIVLAVPCPYLRSIFDPEIAKVDESDRWHVNVYFYDENGYPQLMPVNYGGAEYDLYEYLVPIPSSV